MRFPAEIPYKIEPLTMRRFKEVWKESGGSNGGGCNGGWMRTQTSSIKAPTTFDIPQQTSRRIVDIQSFDFLQRQFCMNHVIALFHEMGLEQRLDGNPTSFSELMTSLRVHKKYHQLVQHLLRQLGQEGYLQCGGGSAGDKNNLWSLASPFPDQRWIRDQLNLIAKDIETSHAEWTSFLELCDKCARALPRILRDEEDPAEVLFPEDGAGADDLYAKLPEVDARDDVLEGIVRSLTTAAAVATCNDKQRVHARILEISSGRDTQTTTRLLTAATASAAGDNGRIDYTVTKPTNGYLRKISVSLPSHAVATNSLNIEYDPKTQGFVPHSYDVIIMINCLHSVKHVSTALAHIRQLLRYEGILVLCERTAPSLGLDITLGLMTNWWRFEDTDRAYILQPMGTWVRFLQEAGFEVGAKYENTEAVLIASATATATATAARTQEPSLELPLSSYPWIIVSNDPSFQQRLETLFGGRVVRNVNEVQKLEKYAGIICVCVGGDFSPFSSLATIVNSEMKLKNKFILVTIRSGSAGVGTPSLYDGMNLDMASMLVELVGPQQILGGIKFTLIEVEDVQQQSNVEGLELEIFREMWRIPNRQHVLYRGEVAHEPVYEVHEDVPIISEPASSVASTGTATTARADFLLVEDRREREQRGPNDRGTVAGIAELIRKQISSGGTMATLQVTESNLGSVLYDICRAHAKSADLRILAAVSEVEPVAWLCRSLTHTRRRRGLAGACLMLSSSCMAQELDHSPLPELGAFLSQPAPVNAVTLIDLRPLIEDHEFPPQSPGIIGSGSGGGGGIGIGGGGYDTTSQDSSNSNPPKKRLSNSATTLLLGKSQEEQLTIIRDVVLDSLSHVSGLRPSDIDDSHGFQEIGLDSLMIMQLVNRLECTLQIELPVTSIFDQPTPNQLVSFLQELLDGERTAAARRQSSYVLFEEDIAIIGAAARVGPADSLDEFWELLLQGRDCITEIPSSRFDWHRYADSMYNHYGSFVNHVDLFDCEFFQVSPVEAALIDPQHRLLLQLAWEALEHACVPPDSLEGSKTGVFLGLCSQDYKDIVHVPEEASGSYCVTSNLQSVASGRISYFLGLQGPSICVDTACSSSLVALHLACSSLIQDDSKLAIVGGVNLILSPTMYISYSKAKMLSRGRHCRPFDNAADGLTRGEGCGVVVLKKLADAWTDGDNVLAVIRGSGMNQDGASAGLTAPNGTAQAQLIRRTLKKAGLTPVDIGYMEAHGTGTALGDPIEVNALDTIFGELGKPGVGRPPLYVGSVKANVGHTEGAAGIIGLLKLCLSLKYGRIPPQINVDTINRHITNRAFFELPSPEPGGVRWDRHKIGCVSSFGVSGTNAFAIVEEAPDYSRLSCFTLNTTTPYMFTISAKGPEALQRLMDAYEKRINVDMKPEEFGRVAYTSNVGRAHFHYRCAIVASDPGEFKEQLRTGNYLHSTAAPRTGLCFLFTGQGSHYKGMGRELYNSHPFYRETFDACGREVEEVTGACLADIFEEDEKLQDAIMNDFVLVQAALFALEYALALYWINLGLVPTYVVGHSLGEYVAAAVAEIVTVKDAITLVLTRASLIKQLITPDTWGMLALSPEAWTKLQSTSTAAAAGRQQVALSAINSPKQVVVSGPLPALRAMGEGILLKVPFGYHSTQMESIVSSFHSEIGRIKYEKPKLDFISTVTGGPVTGLLTTKHWADHLVKPVQFQAALTHVHQTLGCNTFLEIGPKPVLTSFGSHIAPAADFFYSIKPVEPNLSSVVKTLSQLYVLGFEIKFKEFYTERIMKIDIPTYPFDNKRYWSSKLDMDDGQNGPFLGPKKDAAVGVSNVEKFGQSTTHYRPPEVTDVTQVSVGGSAESSRQLVPNNIHTDPQPIKKFLIRTLIRLTGFQTISPTAGFQHLGLDIVMLQQLQTELTTHFKIELPMRMLLGNPSVNILAQRILDLEATKEKGVEYSTAKVESLMQKQQQRQQHLQNWSVSKEVPANQEASSITVTVAQNNTRTHDHNLINRATSMNGFDPCLTTTNGSQTNDGDDLTSGDSAVEKCIAIIGMACKIGPTNSAEEFWTLLHEGRTSITRAPPTRTELQTHFNSRGDPVPFGSFIPDVDEFDANFFNINSHDAAWMDPQERQLLQCTWHALESAGIAPDSVNGTRTGIFVGIAANPDYKRMLDRWLYSKGREWAHSSYTAAGRLGHALDVRGPCLSIDTACGSSLVAVHLATNALRNKEIDMAIVGSSNLTLAPEDFDGFTRTKQTSPDGVVRVFDTAANGFVRGESVCVFILKRQEPVDGVLALIRGSAVANVGFASEFGQATLLREALANAGCEPSDVDYIETHGTGIRDAVEVNAIECVFGTPRENDLVIGSVKPNVGHCEAAAGLVSLVKIVKAMEADRIPKQLNFEKLNLGIKDPDFCRLALEADGVAWPSRETLDDNGANTTTTRAQVAGVTALGSRGGSAHVILESPPGHTDADEEETRSADTTFLIPSPYLFVISARSEFSFKELVHAYGSLPPLTSEDLPNLAFSMTTTRSHFAERRLAIVCSTQAELVNKLRAPIGKSVREGSSSPIYFHFGGCVNFPLEIYEQIPVLNKHYKRLVELCTAQDFLLQTHLTSAAQSIIKDFVSQFILASALIDLGIIPECVSGAWVGELVGAVLAKLLTLADALELVIVRSKDRTKRVAFARTDSSEWVGNSRTTATAAATAAAAASASAGASGSTNFIRVFGSGINSGIMSSIKFRHSGLMPGQTPGRRYWADKCRLVLRSTPSSVGVNGPEDFTVHESGMARKVNDWSSFIMMLGEIWEGREGLQLETLYDADAHEKVALPLYPFEKVRHWYTDGTV